MKTLSKDRQRYVLISHQYAKHNSVYGAYKKPSFNKTWAENLIFNEMRELDGYEYKVLTANCQIFTCAFKYKDKNQQEHMRYYTRDNTYDFIIA